MCPFKESGNLLHLVCRSVAQLVERLALTQVAGGSNPSTPAKQECRNTLFWNRWEDARVLE
jgi:hypothetical protein